MKSSTIFFLPIFSLVLAAGAPAAGQGANDEKLAKSKEYFKKGVALFSAGDHEGALESFLASYKLHPHFMLRLNIGTCLYALKRYAEAGNELEEFLLESGGDIEPKMKQQTLGLLENIVEKVGMVSVSVNIEGVEIRVDGKNFGKISSKIVIYVDPGGHRVVAVPANGGWKAEEVSVATGEKKSVSFVFDEPAPWPSEAKPAPKAPVAASGEKQPHAEAGAKKRLGKGYFYSLLALSVSSLVVGAVLGGLTLKKSGELDDLDSLCAASGCDLDYDVHQDYKLKRRDMYDEAVLMGNLSTGFFVAGGALAAAAIVLSFFTFRGKSKEKSSSRQVNVESSMGLEGATVRISF